MGVRQIGFPHNFQSFLNFYLTMIAATGEAKGADLPRSRAELKLLQARLRGS